MQSWIDFNQNCNATCNFKVRITFCRLLDEFPKWLVAIAVAELPDNSSHAYISLRRRRYKWAFQGIHFVIGNNIKLPAISSRKSLLEKCRL